MTITTIATVAVLLIQLLLDIIIVLTLRYLSTFNKNQIEFNSNQLAINKHIQESINVMAQIAAGPRNQSAKITPYSGD